MRDIKRNRIERHHGNAVENVREYLRANRLCALVWDSYEAIVEACRTAWQFLINDPERIRSIGTREWACVSLWRVGIRPSGDRVEFMR